MNDWHPERPSIRRATGAAILALLLAIPAVAEPAPELTPLAAHANSFDRAVVDDARALLERGRRIFRYDRLGSHIFFSRGLKLHRTLESLAPADALALGVKVDAAALPAGLLAAIIAGEVDLGDPANTVALILLEAVVGVRGQLSDDGRLYEVGITCAFCHSTVDDSVAPGIGLRLDGWANRDLDVGAILAAAPDLRPVADLLGVDVGTVRAVLGSWGPGKFDAHLNLDGQAFRPDGGSASVLIPPAFGLLGVNLATYTGWGSVTFWNALVGNLEMGGLGTFFDPRLDDGDRFPVAAAAGLGDRRDNPDVITEKLAALQYYQLSLPAPAPAAGSVNTAAAARGAALFNGRAQCASCHVPPLYTEPGHNLHRPEDIGIDSFQADRSPTGGYRTTPLRGLWTHTRGGFYHDGRFATLRDVVDHYDSFLGLGLNDQETSDLVSFLLSL